MMEEITHEPFVTQEYVNHIVNNDSSDNFGTIQQIVCANIGGRSLSRVEKGYIDNALYDRRMQRAETNRTVDSLWAPSNSHTALQPCNILMVTAYSNDYSIGGLCEKVNRAYALRHGYEFHSDVLTLSAMSVVIAPKKHCTWYKIALLQRLLSNTEYLAQHNIHYLMWVDADAIVVDQAVQLTDVINRAGGKDLIIAEDMNTGCLINAGVFLLRTTHWSKQFVDDVWSCTRYDDVTFYEQSAMIRSLRASKEGLDTVTPFHSYLPGAVQGIKQFPHVAVLPIAELNTNRGLLCNDLLEFEEFEQLILSPSEQGIGADATPTSEHTCKANASVKSMCYRRDGNYCPLCRRTVGSRHVPRGATTSNNHEQNPSAGCGLFIFHPAGMPEKLKMLHTAIHKHHVDYDLQAEILSTHRAAGAGGVGEMTIHNGDSTTAPVEVATGPLRLVRGKMGQIPQANQSHLFSKLHKNT